MNLIYFLIIIFFLSVPNIFAGQEYYVSSEPEIREYTFIKLEYKIKLARKNDTDHLEIYHNGKIVFKAEEFRFYIYKHYGTTTSHFIGSGIPVLVVQGWTGGKNFHENFLIFELGRKFRYIQTIKTRVSDFNRFENIDNEPDLEFITFSCPEQSCPACLGCDKFDEVAWKYNGNKYVCRGKINLA